MDKVQVTLGILALAFVLRYLWGSSGKSTLEERFEKIGAPIELIEHTKSYEDQRVIKVTDGVYVAVNYGVANSIMLIGPSGLVIVDTMEGPTVAREVAAQFRNITDKETKAVIYTHHHSDHITGTREFLKEGQDPPQIWAHHLFPGQVEAVVKTGQAIWNRGRHQLGIGLTTGYLNSGIGRAPRFEPGSISLAPTHLVKEDMDVTLAGIPLRLVHIPGETSDQMGVWIPDKRILLVGDNVYKSFPNLYAIRGTAPRDVSHWVTSMDKMRQFRPECIIGSHYKPVCGEQDVYDLLSDYMYGIQHVHDQTVRFINKGMHPEEIAQRVKLPAELMKHPFLGQFYGNVPWSVKGVYMSYLGWFSGYPEDLNPLTPSDRAKKMLELLGKKGLLAAAQDALKKDDNQWALELASHVHELEPDNILALEIRRESMAKLAATQMSANGRNFYMTAMMNDAGTFAAFNAQAAAVNLPIDLLFLIMRMRLKAEDIPDGERTTGCFEFTDITKTVCATIHKGIMELDNHELENYDFKLTTVESTFKEILAGKRSGLGCYISGAITIDGGLWKLRKFMNYIDRPSH